MKSRVKLYREEAGMTQKELAGYVGVARRTINALENGKYNPSLMLAYRITIFLGYNNIHDVFRFEKEDLENKKKKQEQ